MRFFYPLRVAKGLARCVIAPILAAWFVIETTLAAWRETGHHNVMRDLRDAWFTNYISVISNKFFEPEGNRIIKRIIKSWQVLQYCLTFFVLLFTLANRVRLRIFPLLVRRAWRERKLRRKNIRVRTWRREGSHPQDLTRPFFSRAFLSRHARRTKRGTIRSQE